MMRLFIISLMIVSGISAMDNGQNDEARYLTRIDRGNTDQKILYSVQALNREDNKVAYSQSLSTVMLPLLLQQLLDNADSEDEETQQEEKQPNIIVEFIGCPVAFGLPVGARLIKNYDEEYVDEDGRYTELSRMSYNRHHPCYRIFKNELILSDEERKKILSFFVHSGIKNGPRLTSGRECVMCYYERSDSAMYDFLKKEYRTKQYRDNWPRLRLLLIAYYKPNNSENRTPLERLPLELISDLGSYLLDDGNGVACACNLSVKEKSEN